MLLLILVGSLVCLFPLGLYCLWLAEINHRPRPTLVNGAWDFAGLLIGLSGFLLFGGPMALLAFDATWRLMLARGRFDLLSDALTGADYTLWLVALLYLVLVLGGAALLIRRRQSVSGVYNVTPSDFHTALTRAIENARLKLAVHGITFRIIGPPATATPAPVPVSAGTAAISPTSGQPARGQPDSGQPADTPALPGVPYTPPTGEIALRIEPAESLRYVTLHWQGDNPAMREAVERELRRTLDEVQSPRSQIASWCLTAASSCFVVIILSLILIILVGLMVNRR